MEKKMVNKTKEVSFYSGLLSDLIEQLKLVETSLIEAGAQSIQVSLEMTSEEYCSHSVIQFDYKILETDEELQKRIVWEDKEQIRKLAQFEKLRKELGK